MTTAQRAKLVLYLMECIPRFYVNYLRAKRGEISPQQMDAAWKRFSDRLDKKIQEITA